jgi:prepilin-type N-terminal cleavage/methylation domain-containing protein
MGSAAGRRRLALRQMDREKGRERAGFTLIELMVVCAVIAIIAVIALPSFLQSRIAANQASAISTLRTLVTANEQYKVRFSSYAGSLADLDAEGYIDPSVGSGVKAGYNFGYVTSGIDFSCSATPVSVNVTGSIYYFVDASGVIRFSSIGAATSTDSALGN